MDLLHLLNFLSSYFQKPERNVFETCLSCDTGWSKIAENDPFLSIEISYLQSPF